MVDKSVVQSVINEDINVTSSCSEGKKQRSLSMNHPHLISFGSVSTAWKIIT